MHSYERSEYRIGGGRTDEEEEGRGEEKKRSQGGKVRRRKRRSTLEIQSESHTQSEFDSKSQQHYSIRLHSPTSF
jgi:hypothetical protein